MHTQRQTEGTYCIRAVQKLEACADLTLAEQKFSSWLLSGTLIIQFLIHRQNRQMQIFPPSVRHTGALAVDTHKENR